MPFVLSAPGLEPNLTSVSMTVIRESALQRRGFLLLTANVALATPRKGGRNAPSDLSTSPAGRRREPVPP